MSSLGNRRRGSWFVSLLASLPLLLLAACAGPLFRHGTPPPPDAAPEAASEISEKPGWTARHFAVAAANPIATDAGYQVLKLGGSAVDAAIAVQMVLALVEPQSSGLGGGAFLLHWDSLKVEAFDGRETAPAAADEKLFLSAEGRPLAFFDAVVGGRSVGVPGALRMLEQAHRLHGQLPWPQLFEPAIQLAEHGFPVSARLNTLIKSDKYLRQDRQAARYFYKPDGTALDVGMPLRNPALAAILRRIATEGADALHTGPIARSIVAKVQGHAGNPGRLSEQDLAGYRPRLREALCADWRQYRLCGVPPPSSGHVAILQMLSLLDQAPPVARPLEAGLPGAEWLHVYTEAARLAFADRAQYLGDPDFVAAPAGSWRSLIDPTYLKQRAALIGGRAMKEVQAGTPQGALTSTSAQAEQPEHGTSHISIIDGSGHALAMTTTIEDQFGSRQMVDGGTGLPGGFLLNNELTDFAFSPTGADGKPVANRVQPGKRPRSSMSPTLVFDRQSGELLMSTGSPGGAMIIHYTAKTLLGVLAWGLNAQQTINLPNFGSTNGPVLLEEKRFPAGTLESLKARGHEVREMPLTSGLQAIQRTKEGWFGGADPRREGVVRGD